MNHKKHVVVLILVAFAFCGCAIKEAGKKIIGTSTKTLEREARRNGVSKHYHCSYQECFETVMALGRRKESAKPWAKKDTSPDDGIFDILMSDLYSNPPYIVIIGVAGNVNTTEVGIFLTRTDRDTIRVDISSLSSTAKRSASDIIFAKLGENYTQPQ